MVIGIDASRANIQHKTGTEWYSWHLIRHLAPRLAGHTIRLYTREPLEAGLQHLGPQVEERVLAWRLGFLWSHLRLSWEMLWHPPDVLFVPADTVPIVHPTKTVTTIHDIAFERFPELYSTRSVQRRLGWLRPVIHVLVWVITLGRYGASELDYHRWSVRHALHASRKIISVSEFTKRELIDALGADPGQIVVTHQGVIQPAEVAQEIVAAEPDLFARHRIHSPYFLYNGRIERKKNLIQLLEGFQHFRADGGPAELVLVGPRGIGAEEVDDWLEKHPPVAAAVHQLPWQSVANLWLLMRSAVGYAFISAYEGFGRPPLEALSCGTAVIASRSTSLPEVLGNCAIFVSPEKPTEISDAMHQLLRDHARRSKLVACGQMQVQKFTWPIVADKTAHLLLNC